MPWRIKRGVTKRWGSPPHKVCGLAKGEVRAQKSWLPFNGNTLCASPLHGLSHLIPTATLECKYYYFLILWMSKLRPGAIKSLAQGHIEGAEWGFSDSASNSLTAGAKG